MKSNFQSDGTYRAPEKAALIDPEAYDASEQQFAASLDEPDSGVVEKAGPLSGESTDAKTTGVYRENPAAIQPEALTPGGLMPPAAFVPSSNPGEWRQEVAARLNNYRARRRPREPRYPSLQLKFEPSEPAWSNAPPSRQARFHPSLDGYAAAAQLAHNGWPADESPVEAIVAETTARVIPFRRSAPTPPRALEELAEPLQLFPRILEVPEVAPPPPALGGILIEPSPEEPNPKRPGIEIPLQTSPISRRLLAASLDGLIVASAFCLFAYIYFRVTATIPPLKQFGGTAALILGVLWAGYQYLLLTYSGATPGLRLAKLRLSRFDGNAVPRRARRRRAFASILSALSLGLGYAWCLLDEDQLCWHDRITRTHLAPKH